MNLAEVMNAHKVMDKQGNVWEVQDDGIGYTVKKNGKVKALFAYRSGAALEILELIGPDPVPVPEEDLDDCEDD